MGSIPRESMNWLIVYSTFNAVDRSACQMHTYNCETYGTIKCEKMMLLA